MRWLAAVLLSAALVGCAPVADVVADAIERGDGATLSYVTGGLTFDPGETGTRGVVLVAEGEGLRLTAATRGCVVTQEILKCTLGVVSEPLTVHVSGKNVLASVTYRRLTASTLYFVFAR